MPSTMSEYAAKMLRIREYLGGKCVECDSTEKLQIDHIDHTTKCFTIGNNWGLSWERLEPELKKCQLLCKSCHLKKSQEEGSLAKGWTNQPRLVHGSAHTYNKHKCRCDLCKEAKRATRKKYDN